VNDRAVLGDQIIEQPSFGKYIEKIAQLARGHQNQFAARRGKRTQSGKAAFIAAPIARERAIESGG
jgi:hypothetical protein